MKPGAITTLFLEEIIYVQELCRTVSRKVIYRANIRSAHTKMDHNKHIDLLGRENVTLDASVSMDTSTRCGM